MRLLKWLEREGMARAEFAERTAATIAAVNHWCVGRRVPTLANLDAIDAITGGEVQEADFRRAAAALRRRQAATAVPIKQTHKENR